MTLPRKFLLEAKAFKRLATARPGACKREWDALFGMVVSPSWSAEERLTPRTRMCELDLSPGVTTPELASDGLVLDYYEDKMCIYDREPDNLAY